MTQRMVDLGEQPRNRPPIPLRQTMLRTPFVVNGWGVVARRYRPALGGWRSNLRGPGRLRKAACCGSTALRYHCDASPHALRDTNQHFTQNGGVRPGSSIAVVNRGPAR